MIKLITFFIYLFIFPINSLAELTFEQLEEISITPENLEGNFSQEKYLSVLDTSLTSSGIFKYQRSKQIHWKTLKPIQNELIMTPEKVVNKQGDKILMQLDINENPTITILSKIFFSVLTSDWGKLSDHFNLTGTLEGEKWDAELVPLDKTIAQVVSQIELKGDVLLHKIVMYESEGNRTTITFTDLDNYQE